MSISQLQTEFDWVIEKFPEQFVHLKKMFGGLALYYNGKMVLIFTNSKGDSTYKGKKYDFDIWNGILLLTDHSYQSAHLAKYKSLVQHPIIKKWLYIPLTESGHSSEINIENDLDQIAREIKQGSEAWGVWPKPRTKPKKESRNKKTARKVKSKLKLDRKAKSKVKPKVKSKLKSNIKSK